MGLIPIDGAFPAEKNLEMLRERLAEFGLNLEKDVVGPSNDGCSAMLKLGTLIKNIQALCQIGRI